MEFVIAALWTCVVVQFLLILALARQVGLLNERLGPVGARAAPPGPDIGTVIDPVELADSQTRSITIGGRQAGRTLAVFVTAGCPACTHLVPALKTIQRSTPDVEVVPISLDAATAASTTRGDADGYRPLPLVYGRELGREWRISVTPYAVLLDSGGAVVSKGLVSHLEHLESLLDTDARAASRGSSGLTGTSREMNHEA